MGYGKSKSASTNTAMAGKKKYVGSMDTKKRKRKGYGATTTMMS
jgi:hypothetical protein